MASDPEKRRERQRRHRRKQKESGIIRKEVLLRETTDFAKSKGYNRALGVWINAPFLKKLEEIAGKNACLGVKGYKVGEEWEFRLVSFVSGD